MEANQISTKEELDLYLNNLINDPSESETPATKIASAALAVISFMLKINNEKFNVGPEVVEETIWTLMENALDPEILNLLKNIKLKNLMYPQHSSANCIFIDLEIFQSLQDDAKKSLKEHPDATDHMRYFWKSLTRGELPPNYVIRQVNLKR